MNMADVREELASHFRTAKVALQLPFGYGEGASAEIRGSRLEFTRDEFLALYEVHDHVAEVLLRSFVEKYVMHYDLLKEDVVGSITSIKENAAYLDRKLNELRGKLPPAQRGLIRILDLYRSNCEFHAKKIDKLRREIEEGNSGEWESEYRIGINDWLPRPLREFRLSVYPLVRTLIDTLPDDDPVKSRTLQVWYEGRKILEESQKDQTLPLWLIERHLEPNPLSIPDPVESGSLLRAFLRGVGSVLEFFPPPERFARWRLTQDTLTEEWPEAVRGMLSALQEDATQREGSA